MLGRWSWPTDCVRPDAWQRGRHHHGATSVTGRGAAQASDRRQGLRRAKPEGLAEEPPGDRHHPVHGHPDGALKAQPDRLPAAQSDRAAVWPPLELAARCDQLRSPGPQLSGRRRARFLCHRSDLNESPT